MSLKLQIFMIIVSLTVFLLILWNIKKSKLSTDMATVWILWGIGLIVLSIFPQIIGFIGNIIGIVTPMNTLYLVTIFLLYILVFFLYIKLSLLEERTKNLAHAIALMKKEYEETIR